MNDDLKDLDQKIETVRKSSEPKEDEQKTNMTQGMNAGYTFLSYAFAGGIVGYFIDVYFNSLPLGLISMIVLGFALGVFHANKSMNKD